MTAKSDTTARDARIWQLHTQGQAPQTPWQIVDTLLEEGLLPPAATEEERKKRWNLVRAALRRLKEQGGVAGDGDAAAAATLENKPTETTEASEALTGGKPAQPARVDTVPITALRLGGRHRKELGDIDALAESIGVLGLLHPLVATPDFHVIAGERRLRAVEKLGWR
jgi:hypothetical protein